MNEQTQINIMAIYHETRTRYITEARKRVSLSERIQGSLPSFLLVVQLVFFILSAAHTTSMVSRLVPPIVILGFSLPVAWVAPIGFELGLLAVAMMNYSAKRQGQAIELSSHVIEGLLFTLTLLSNFAGSMMAAIAATSNGTSNMSFDQLRISFGSLQFVDQLSIIMALVFSVAIPVGSNVIGRSVAHLVFERRTNGDPAELRWKVVEYEETVKAMFQVLVQAGNAPRDAKKLALQIAAGLVTAPATNAQLLSSGSDKSDRPNKPDKPNEKRTDQTDRSDAERTKSDAASDGKSDKKLPAGERVRRWLSENGTDHTVQQVADGVDVSRDTAWRVLAEVKAAEAKAERPVEV